MIRHPPRVCPQVMSRQSSRFGGAVEQVAHCLRVQRTTGAEIIGNFADLELKVTQSSTLARSKGDTDPPRQVIFRFTNGRGALTPGIVRGIGELGLQIIYKA